ncbi:MAG: tetraacyldisaccharide 4'-kinase [Pyrinomonadaceae bacterium]|nr:tetraacyldisaccharide 4'-kinase [Pyrinomonadaceae bacterium]
MPLGWIYGKIADIRNARFDRGRLASSDLGARTISIGNITAGGTGKTPLVILVCQLLAGRGKRVCVLTRGHGRKDVRSRVVVSNGKRVMANAVTAGDEPVEIATRLLGKAVVVADADRVGAAEWAKGEFGVTTFVLDDGFQHRYAKRDVDIVCIDALEPFGRGKMLPFGRLREPLHNLRRANAVIITRANLVSDVEAIKAEIRKHNPDCRIFVAGTRTADVQLLGKFIDPLAPEHSDADNDLRHVAHATAFAFCGIGNPKSFFDQLRKENYQLAGTHEFADHHKYDQNDADKVIALARTAGAGFLLTTAKDAVKLAGLHFSLPCFVLISDVVLDDRESFAAML